MDHAWRDRTEIRYRIEVDVKVRLEGTFQWQSAKLVNLSRSGACVNSKLQLDVARPVELEIPVLAGAEHLGIRRLLAEIVWAKGQKYGLKFKASKSQSSHPDSSGP